MANGKRGRRGGKSRDRQKLLGKAAGLAGAAAGAAGPVRGTAALRKALGMTKRPTTAGQARFGDVDVTGAQTTAREQGRLNERLGEAAPGGLIGAQMTEAERRRLKGGR